MNNANITQVPELRYLVSIFTEDVKVDREIKTRCLKTNAVTYQLSPLFKHPNTDIPVK
uniref:Uncharacterized protein n=1 Tax=Arion vulgaris TaxID=1028688 RepID=A0A0B7AIA8_9EUPU